MSASGGDKAIVAAFAANLGIAVTKFIAWAFSGSSSRLAEAMHSVAIILGMANPPTDTFVIKGLE
jgi:divalent metal cation (Fe/Co/Zn/Cd) transporter